MTAEQSLERLPFNPIQAEASRSETLGQVSEKVEGDIYHATFTGSGWIRTEQDEGTFLANVSQSDLDEIWRQGKLIDSELDEIGHQAELTPVLEEKRLDISDLFPLEWQGGVNRTLDTEVVYEISIKAKRIKSKPIRVPKGGGNA